jgi:hypothetical protein
MSKPQIGSCWRVLVQEPALSIESGNYQGLKTGTSERGGVLDEVVIIFDPKNPNASCLHLEQMSTRSWYLGFGDIKLNIRVKLNGTLDVTHYDGPDIREGRTT